MKTFKLVFAVLALFFWFSSFFVWKYYGKHECRTCQIETGRVYMLNSHGSIVYLTAGQHYFLFGLMAAGVGFFIMTGVVYFIGKKQ